MRKCPSCEKMISEYASKCPNCGYDLTHTIVTDTEKVSDVPIRKPVGFRKPSAKVILAVCFAAVALFAIVYLSQPLHGDDKIAYDLITNSYHFQKARDIEVLSGSVNTNSSDGEKFACLTIAYTDSRGIRIEGHYEITKEGVTSIDKAMNEAKNIAESTKGGDTESILAVQQANIQYTLLEASLAVSEFDDRLNYEKITSELNK